MIKNQPFTPYVDADGHEINLYYNVRTKGHFDDKWEVLYSDARDSLTYPVQSNSEYTVLLLSADYPDGAKVDFQVVAIVGYSEYWAVSEVWLVYGYLLESVDESGWSNT